MGEQRYVVPKSEETKDFADLIESLPDALPCHLATILYLPCYKVCVIVLCF
jgi:hypothetical protein